MSTETNRVADIKATDLVFDCPYCGKSLAIDYHGAGLTIQCTDCQKDVMVPIPEGMEVTDFDTDEKDRELQILHLRRSLTMAEERIKALQQERENDSRAHTGDSGRFKDITDSVVKIEAMLEELQKLCQAIRAQAVRNG